MPRLIDATGRIYPLSGGVTVIGRSGADIAFVDSTVAPRQARVAFEDGYYMIEDLAGSTLLNGQPLRRPAPLRSGDRITAGRRELTVEDVPAPPAGALPRLPETRSTLSPQAVRLPESVGPRRSERRPEASPVAPVQPSPEPPGRTVTPRGARSEPQRRLPQEAVIAVTRKQWDDIGSILRKLGPGYAYDEINLGKSLSKLDKYKILFINCHAVDAPAASKAADALASFMHGGGSVYASDHSGQYLEAACPGSIELASVALPGRIDARVVDEGLMGLLGRRVKLTFDLPDWKSVAGAMPSARTYLVGAHRKLLGLVSSAEQPLLVSFEHGGGTAVFTSFHNHKQPTIDQEKLLEFLVLRPITASALRATTQELSQQRLRTIRDSVHKLSAGRRTEPYSFALPATRRAALVLTPAAEGAELEVSVLGPGGAAIAKEVSRGEPVSIALPVGPTNLVYEVKALSTPYDNFPFTVSIAVE